jgi:uncharacterized iron-regulated membrane protein
MLVEVVAGWAIVMIATGVFLWWPRGQTGGVLTVRGAPKLRVFWRDLHAVIGVAAAGVILFLAVTGMPWSAVWGEQFRRITNEAGWGAPKPPAGVQALHHDSHKIRPMAAVAAPWSLQGMDMRMDHQMGEKAPAPAASLDEIVRRVDAAGLPRPYAVSFPKASGLAWSASRVARRVEDTRTLYLDGASGAVIADIGYDRYGPAAKAVQWGVAVHQGDEYGPINRYVMLGGCVSIWLLGISAVVMWWKRRPRGRLAAPPRPADRRAYLGLAAVVVPLGLIYPLVGASLLVVLGLDMLVRRLAAGGVLRMR